MGMGRKRKNRKDLPERMYFKHGAYFFVDRGGKWHRLDQDYYKAMVRYAALNESPVLASSIGALMDHFVEQELPRRAPRTQKNYLADLKRLRAVFGAMRPEDLTKRDICAYMGLRPRVAANREKALLGRVFACACEKHLIENNPVVGIRANIEAPRARLVQWAEFWAVHGMTSTNMQIAMELAVQTGLRLGDLIRLRWDQWRKDGLYVETRKTGKRLLIAPTADLTSVMVRARSNDPVTSITILANTLGTPYTEWSFKSAWQRLMRRALDTGVIAERFTFHDLRALAASAHADPTRLLGHQDPRTTNRTYLRGPTRVTPAILDKGPDIRQADEEKSS